MNGIYTDSYITLVSGCLWIITTINGNSTIVPSREFDGLTG